METEFKEELNKVEVLVKDKADTPLLMLQLLILLVQEVRVNTHLEEDLAKDKPHIPHKPQLKQIEVKTFLEEDLDKDKPLLPQPKQQLKVNYFLEVKEDPLVEE